jgi:hypothetical protein
LCESPLITDGKDIYVISTLREEHIVKKEEENLDEDRKELRVIKWILEIYDGTTWEYKKSIDLKIDVKPRNLDEVLTEEEEKELENIKKLKESFAMSNIDKLVSEDNYKTA